MSKTVLSCLIISILLCCNVGAVDMETKSPQQKEHFKKDIVMSVDINYLLYLPKDYNSAGNPFPLIVFLHGAGERGDNLDQLKVHGIPKILETDGNFPFVVVSPQCPANTTWAVQMEVLKALIDYIKAEYNIDTSRVYLTGLSMGGYGAWLMAEQYPQLFAAIAPVCGGGEKWLAGNLDMPIWAFHGAKDDVVPLQKSQEMVDAVKKAGGNVQFTVYPELGHNCWTATYENKELYKWFLRNKRIIK